MSNAKGYVHAIDQPITNYRSVFSGLQAKYLLLPAFLVTMDYIAIIGAVWVASLFRIIIAPYFINELPANFMISQVFVYLFIPFVFFLFLHFDRLYTRRLLFWQQLEKLFKVSIYAMLSLVVVTYLTGEAKEISRIFMVVLWVSSFIFLVVDKWLSRQILTLTGLWQIPVVLIGAGKTAELLVNAFKRDSGLGYKIVGLVEDNEKALGLATYPVIGTFAEAEMAVKRMGVKNVLIAAPGLVREELHNMVYRLQPHVDNITFVPDLFGVPVRDMELDTLFNEKAVLLRVRNNLAQCYNRIFKRTFDMVCSTIGLVVLSPILLIVALLIFIDNPGQVIFAHNRIGKGGNVFPCYKFRSMVINAQAKLEEYLQNNPAAREEWERDFKLKDDPRITKIGAFLRKTSLDELPQLFNVVKGEMSLVGPRPIVAAEVERYSEYIGDYYLVRPGITGMWQVSGRSELDYQERVQLDSWYVRNWSLWIDITLLVKTVGVVLKRKGAY